MNRKSFAQRLALLGICPFMIQNLSGSSMQANPAVDDDKLQALQSQKQFVENWLADLLDSMDTKCDFNKIQKHVGAFVKDNFYFNLNRHHK